MFAPHHYGQIIISNVGIFIWLGAIAASINTWGFFTVFRTYLIPYLWYVTYFLISLDIYSNAISTHQGQPLARPHHLLATH